MTSPTPPPSDGGFDVSDLLVPAGLSAFGPLGTLLAGAWSLFGVLTGDTGSSMPERHVAGTPTVDPKEFSGQNADAEAAAGQKLTGQTETLKTLDKQLDDLSKKITDQNNAARQKLLDIKGDIDKELEYLNTTGDDNIQKSAAVSKFMQDKAADIAKVITDAAAAVSANQGELQQLGNQYQQGDPNMPGTVTPDPGGDYGSPGTDPGGDPGGYGADPYGQGDPYGGYGSDYGYGDGAGYGADPASQLGQMLPQMASALPGALSGMNPLASGMGGLGDLGSVIGDAVRSGNSRNTDGEKSGDESDKKNKPDDQGDNKKPEQNEQKHDQSGQTTDQNQQNGQQGNQQQQTGATPSPTPPPAPPAPSLVKRPDGSSATAVSPAVASAANAHLGGAAIEDAYKAAGITLPPPGTQIKDTLPSLSMAQPGDLAVFKDKYVMLLGDGKIYLDGQEQPVSALAKLTGFVAFCHPPASSTPNVPVPAAPVPAAPPAAATQPAGV
ncbi:DUF4226 domain-containing protein [Mycobacterium avium subsp. hominissuis]|uniref:DUF4226 domain-containing protein n=2 Tax=Mycobacterium TaxID=1763 RepID=A0AA37V119_9MYCO|nr:MULTISPECIES: DUF4226 domain-containing protein [Mycobacterium]APA78443.2 DUF4226 domain-containing protein [Mycobacterium avium subsp. hominissuis]PBJ37155.1 DUF4226 domain-containing protein [Mycobacterium avium subsp. hominissuis]PBJ66266.1 DUF4226 domain-containing protein [Mycobacterium avium subsp. hominissuis]GLB86808.1 hypothetical protein SRL2020028_60640 [Mycobacterium kiyosense]